MIQYLIAGLVGGAVAMSQKPKKKTRRKYAEGGKTREVKVYSIEELDDSGVGYTPRDRALDEVREQALSHDWWDYIYDDAKQVGVEIQGFDLGRGRSIEVKLVDSAEDVCQAIIDEHGDADEEISYILAELKRLTERIDEAYDSEDGEDSEGLSEYELEAKYEEVVEDLIEYVKQYYFRLLQSDYDYMSEDDYLIEFAEANAMEFDKDGYVFRYAKGGRMRGRSKVKRFAKGGKTKDYDAFDYLYDYATFYQDSPFQESRAFKVKIYDDESGMTRTQQVWAESEKSLRQDLSKVMTDSQAIEWIVKVDPRKTGRKLKMGGRVSTYDYVVGGNPQKPFDVLGRKDGMVMYHTSQASIKDSADKAEELLENGYDEVLIAQP